MCKIKEFKIIDKFSNEDIKDGGYLSIRVKYDKKENLDIAYAWFEVDIHFEEVLYQNKQQCHCCEVRQYVKQDYENDYHEDQDRSGSQYGHRQDVPDTEMEMYYDYTSGNVRSLNQSRGNSYWSQDTPNTAKPLDIYMFEVRVIDTCNKNRIVDKKNFTILWTFEQKY